MQMWTDLVALSLLVGCVILGAVRGTLAGLVQTVTLVGSYAAAYLAATRLGEAVGTALGAHALAGSIVAGVVTFLAASVVLGIVGGMLRRRSRRRHADRSRSGLDRLGGAAIGALHGIVLALIVGWLGSLLEAARLQAQPVAVEEKTESAPPRLAQSASSTVVRATAGAVIGSDPGARLGVNLAADPAGTLAALRAVLDNPRIQSLQHDELFWQYVSTGAIDSALNRASFLGIAYDSTLRGQLVDLGLASEAARVDARLFRNSCREVLRRIAPALQGLREDPEVWALVGDPKVQEALAAGNTLTLLADPRFRRLASRVMSRVEPDTPESTDTP